MKKVCLWLIVVFVLGALWAGIVGGFDKRHEESLCEHVWTAGASQEYAQRLLADGWIPPIYYYTCISCGEEIGSTCELDTSVAGDMFTKATESSDLVIDIDSAIDPNIIWSADAHTTYADLMICWDGGEITMSVDGDKLEITGDTDKMNEAAKVFFDEMVKPMADAYIAERLND